MIPNKSPPRMLHAQRRGKRRLTHIASTVVAVFLIVGLLAGLSDPDTRQKILKNTIGEYGDGVGPRRIVQESPTKGKASSAILLQGSFGEESADLVAEDEGAQTPVDTPPLKVELSSTRNPLPGDTGATWKGACQRLAPPLVPELAVKKIWQSNKTRSSMDITLVTQLSIDRLPALANQCSVWSGVISAAVYVPMVAGSCISTDEALHGMPMTTPIKILEEFIQKQEDTGICKLDILYIIQELETLDEVGLYPVNALRNRALQLATTDLVLLLDADFIPNTQLSTDLSDPAQYELLLRATAGWQAIVLPALEVLVEGRGGEKLAFKAAEDKETTRKMMRNGKLQGFHMDGFLYGHRATDYDRWFDTTVAYRAIYEEGFEPYVIVQRSMVPWYDERFKGYRKNKVVHLMHMQRLGINYVVTPKAWVVHVPHTEANTWQVTKQTGTWKKLKKLYSQLVQEMEEDVFIPATSFRCEDKELSKWSWYKKI